MAPPLRSFKSYLNSLSSLENSEQRDLTAALVEIASALNQSLNIHEVLDLILENIKMLVPYDAINIMLVEEETAIMVACRGYENHGGNEKVLGLQRKISSMPNLQNMVMTGTPIIVPDTRSSTQWVPLSTSSWICSYASAPIVHQGKTIGFINLNSATPNFYTASHSDRLLAFADQAAIAIQNATLFAKAQAEITERKRIEEALKKANDELELRVTLRTKELNLANENLTIELTRRKQAESDVQMERMLLAKRVDERTKELSVANSELAKAAKMKDSFLASMSHELRTPLNAILNISETLQEQLFGDLNEAQMRLVRTCEESGRHLLALINDILDLSKIDAGKLELMCDVVPVKVLCDSSLRIVEPAAQKKQIVVSVQYDPQVKVVWADQRRLKQILVNLLSNAVKFTPHGGTIGLSVTGDTETKQVHFCVWDSGIGISPEDFPHLFKPFVQLDNSLSRSYEGTGLGLALVYHITELHRGGVSVASQPGQGSRFTVTLPWDKKFGPTTAQLLNPDQEVDWRQMNDEAYIAPHVLLVQYLNELGIEVEVRWLDPESLSENVGSADLVVAHVGARAIGNMLRGELLLSTEKIPTLILPKAVVDSALFQKIISDNTAFLNVPFNRSDLRLALKQISPSGTGSLIHKALFLDETDLSNLETLPKILVVDDNETSVRIFHDYLETIGFRVAVAHNGANAIQKAREFQPNLIIMDIQMPGMDGFEAIRRIRADETIQSIPILAVTALAMPGDRERCLEFGANEYLSKPIVLKQLVQTIQSFIPNLTIA